MLLSTIPNAVTYMENVRVSMRTLSKWNRQGAEEGGGGGGEKGLEMDIYTYIQSAGFLSIDPRRMWRPTEVTPKERARDTGGREEKDKRGRERESESKRTGRARGRNRRERGERETRRENN